MRLKWCTGEKEGEFENAETRRYLLPDGQRRKLEWERVKSALNNISQGWNRNQLKFQLAEKWQKESGGECLPDLAGFEVEDLEWFIEDDVPLKESMKRLSPKQNMKYLDPKARGFEDDLLKSKGKSSTRGGREQKTLDGRFHQQGKKRAAEWELEPKYQSKEYKATMKCKYWRFGRGCWYGDKCHYRHG